MQLYVRPAFCYANKPEFLQKVITFGQKVITSGQKVITSGRKVITLYGQIELGFHFQQKVHNFRSNGHYFRSQGHFFQSQGHHFGWSNCLIGEILEKKPIKTWNQKLRDAKVMILHNLWFSICVKSSPNFIKYWTILKGLNVLFSCWYPTWNWHPTPIEVTCPFHGPLSMGKAQATMRNLLLKWKS